MDLKGIVSSLKKKYRTCNIASELKGPVDFLSTGNLAFDLILDGGVPFGYTMEFLGLSSSGKSLFIHKLIGDAQSRYGAIGILVDRENAYFPKRGEQLGIDNERLIRATPQDTSTVIEGFQFIKDAVNVIRKTDLVNYNALGNKVEDIRDIPDEHKSYIVIGLDSISAFDKDTELNKSDQGRKAKSSHEGLRSLTGIIDSRMVFLVANQVTYKIGVMFGDPRTSTAGESMKYYSTIRVALEDKRKIVDTTRNNEVIGSWIEVEAIKTRLGPCFRSCFVRHYYDTGIDYYSGYARLLVHRGYMTPKNKSEFDKFKQATLNYKDVTINENEIEAILVKYPKLKFANYPPWCGDTSDPELEDLG